MLRLLYVFFLLLLAPFGTLRAETGTPIPEYHLSISFDIADSKLTGQALLNAEADKTVMFEAAHLAITRVSLNDRDIPYTISDGKLIIKTPGLGVLLIEYEATFKPERSATTEKIRSIESSIDNRGIFLTGNWYPKMQGTTRYRLRAMLPDGYQAVSEAEEIEKKPKGPGTEWIFLFDHPLYGLTLIADRYEIMKEQVNDIDLYGYFLRREREAGRRYLEQAKKYLQLYEKMLGKYPYKRFSLVQNFLPFGDSVPTFTLLSRSEVPLFPESSLAREILRQWFGNSVYIDLEKGNWAAGLTSYLADHLYEEQAGRGPEYRKQLLIDYEMFVNSKNETSLREFKTVTDRASKAIGNGKGAVVFHMLMLSLGREAFFSALKSFINEMRYRAASWEDIRAAFEKQTGKNLTAFFKQWVDQKGLPELDAEKSRVTRKGDSFETSLDMVQKRGPYELGLSCLVSLSSGRTKKEQLNLDTERKNFTISTDDSPSSILIDGEYDVARKLTAPELPPLLAKLFGSGKHLIVQPVSNKEAYTKVIDGLKQLGGEEKTAAELKDEAVKSSSLVVLGNDNPVIGRLFGRLEGPKAGFCVTVKKNPWNSDNVIVLINAESAEEAAAAFPKLSDYGQYTILAFEQGKNVLKKTEISQGGIRMDLREPATAIDLSALKTLGDVIQGTAGKRIVYVGEYHDKFAHHDVQLQIIRSLYERNQKLAIGMEMFQRPFQKIVDDYIGGVIEERAFLKGTEYFKRWVFDYNLYKPILDFARDRKIPVIALNQKKEITDKVSRGGMDSLSDSERKEIPAEMDFSDNDYRERLQTIFTQHRVAGEKNFDFFYQAQLLWDETMAQSIDEFLQKNPDHVMVVIAGAGHLAYGSGIPKRSYRRNRLPYYVILNDSEVDKDIANYLVLTQPLEGMTAPKLMVGLKVENNKVSVTELPDESVSKKAGIRLGDILLSLDNDKIESVEDIKLALFYKKKGDILKVKVLRKQFFRDREIEFDVKL